MIIQQPDTLVCDSVRLALWQNDPAYDYNRELMAPDVNLMELFFSWFQRLMRLIFGNKIAEQYSEIILISIFVVIVVGLIWFIYKKRPELFTRNRKSSLPYEVHEDTIYGVDFDAEIIKALKKNDYRESVRLLYLQTLKYLSDNSLLDWQLYKTPTQYVYEVKPEANKKHLRELTNRFLRVRYGNFEATQQLFDEMKAIQADIMKGGQQ